jgi:hypothetical protein
MTSPSPPNRRRRRIVITIAVLVLGLGLWFWPRADQRFVGTWRVCSAYYDGDIGEYLAFPQTNESAFTLRANGTGFSSALAERQISHCWWIKGDDFWITTSEWTALAQAEAAYFRLTGRSLGIADLSRDTIMRVTKDRFVIDWTGTHEFHEGPPAELFVRETVGDGGL